MHVSLARALTIIPLAMVLSASAVLGQQDTLMFETLPPDSIYTDSGIFVATTGNDSTGNGSIGLPYRTVGRALQDADSGDVITMRGGTYNEMVEIDQPGITLRSAWGEWAHIANPYDNTAIQNSVYLDLNARHSQLQRLEISGGYYYAIKLESAWGWGNDFAHHILIDGCTIHGSGRDCIKITPGCDDVTIRRCEIYDSGLRDPSNADGIDNVNADRCLVQDCHIHDIATNGLYFKGGAASCVAERCLVENTGSGGIFVGFDTSPEWFDTLANPNYYENINGVVRNCIVRNTVYAGIAMYGAYHPKIYNNTIINTAASAHSPIYFGLTYQDWEPHAGRPPTVAPVIKNNIACQGPGYPGDMVFIRYSTDLGGMRALSGMPVMDRNRYYRASGTANFEDRRPESLYSGDLAGWRTHSGGDSHSYEADPLLDGTGHLTSASTCIDSAEAATYVTYDYDRAMRSGLWDIGADEYGASGVSGSIASSGPGRATIRSEPNPFSASTTIRCELPAAGRVRIAVYNIAGQQVRTLVDAGLPAGKYHIVWDGQGDRGAPARAGVYLLRVQTSCGNLLARLVKVR